MKKKRAKVPKVYLNYVLTDAHETREHILIGFAVIVSVLFVVSRFSANLALFGVLCYPIVFLLRMIKEISRSTDRTKVELYEDKLLCICGEWEWDINFRELKKVTYSVEKAESEYGKVCLDARLYFWFGDRRDGTDEALLTDDKDYTIMQIYRWIEERYPEKAGGEDKMYQLQESQWDNTY